MPVRDKTRINDIKKQNNLSRKEVDSSGKTPYFINKNGTIYMVVSIDGVKWYFKGSRTI